MSKIMLVSDYDGTLNPKDSNTIHLNIEAIKKFRDAGNLFVLSTGRNFSSIKKEVKKFDIPYDYLTCSNGMATFDQNDELITAFNISDKNVFNLYQFLEKYGQIKNIYFKDIYGNIYTSLTEENKILIAEVILLAYLGDQSKLQFFLKNTIGNDCHLFKILNNYYIKQKNDKAKAIFSLNDYLNNDNYDIITIGNGFNDKTMLTEYNGYKLPNSFPTLHMKRIKTIDSVHSLIKRIN